jgi:Subunit 21 of Mediator complex
MTDILTQLHTTYDQLLTQIFSTLSYLTLRHPTHPPQPDPHDPYTTSTAEQIAPGPEDTTSHLYPLRPDSEAAFALAQEELAEDLVQKGAQIEDLIRRLPGRARGEEVQEERIRELVGRVKEVEGVRRAKRREVRALVARLDAVVLGMSSSIKINVEGKREGGAGREGNNGDRGRGVG